MTNRVNNHYITDAIAELVGVLGVRHDIPYSRYQSDMRAGRLQQCVERIAQDLTLPVRIRIEATSAFQSGALAPVGSDQDPAPGITAQVRIPSDLPLYGTSWLTNYPIDVRISPECSRYPLTFITIMAHELSHILLQSLRHRESGNEIYVDLVPLLLGFAGIVAQGRKLTRREAQADKTWRTTTTYGYLTDTQFDHAVQTIQEMHDAREAEKRTLCLQVDRTRSWLSESKVALALFEWHIEYLDQHTHRRISPSDAQILVRLHSPNRLSDARRCVARCETLLANADSFCHRALRYTDRDISALRELTNALCHAEHADIGVWERISEDLDTLCRNVGFLGRIKARRACGKW